MLELFAALTRVVRKCQVRVKCEWCGGKHVLLMRSAVNLVNASESTSRESLSHGD